MYLFRPAVLAAAILLFLSGCSHKPVQPLFETLAIDSLIGTEANGCRIEYRYLTITNAEKSPALQAIEQANTNYFFELEDFAGTPAEAAAESIRELSAELELPGGLGNGEVSVEAEAGVQDTLLNYAIIRSSYTGGAHGIYGIENHTYSLAGGYELMLADLFAPQTIEGLNRLIRTKLYAQYGAANDDQLAAQGFFLDCIAANENFRITPEGITFYYNPYEIGCYALGGVEVAITSEELADMDKQ